MLGLTALVSVFPDVGQTDCGVVAVEYGQWNGHVRNEAPRQRSIELYGYRTRIGMQDLERIDSPERRVASNEESHVLSTRFVQLLLSGSRGPSQPVENEQRLDGGLEDSDAARQHYKDTKRRFQAIGGADSAEDVEHVDADESDEQKDLVEEAGVVVADEAQTTKAERSSSDGEDRQDVQDDLSGVHEDSGVRLELCLSGHLEEDDE